MTSDLPLEIAGTVINAYGAEKSPVMWALVVSDKPRLTADLRVRLHTPVSIVHLGLNSATTNTLEAEITTNLVECDNQDRPPWTLIGQRLLNGEPLYPPEGVDESSSEESEEEGVAD